MPRLAARPLRAPCAIRPRDATRSRLTRGPSHTPRSRLGTRIALRSPLSRRPRRRTARGPLGTRRATRARRAAGPLVAAHRDPVPASGTPRSRWPARSRSSLLALLALLSLFEARVPHRPRRPRRSLWARCTRLATRPALTDNTYSLKRAAEHISFPSHVHRLARFIYNYRARRRARQKSLEHRAVHREHRRFVGCRLHTFRVNAFRVNKHRHPCRPRPVVRRNKHLFSFFFLFFPFFFFVPFFFFSFFFLFFFSFFFFSFFLLFFFSFFFFFYFVLFLFCSFFLVFLFFFSFLGAFFLFFFLFLGPCSLFFFIFSFLFIFSFS